MAFDSAQDRVAGLFASEHSVPPLQQRVARLYEEAREDVYRYLLTLGLYPPQAQEAAQEVFLRLYSALRKGEDVRNERAWVFRVAHNYGLKVRARQNWQAPFDVDLESVLAARERNPEQAVLDRERVLRLHRGIRGLSDQQRRCLFLRMEGLRYPEIAETLGISASAVGEFLRRAIGRLRKASHE